MFKDKKKSYFLIVKSIKLEIHKNQNMVKDSETGIVYKIVEEFYSRLSQFDLNNSRTIRGQWNLTSDRTKDTSSI